MVAALVLSFAISYQGTKYYFAKDENVLGTEDIALEITPTSESDPTETPTPTLEPTSTPTPTEFLTPTPTSAPQPRHVSQPNFTEEEIYNFINRFAGQYGVSPDVLRHIATCESGFNAQSVNGPYVGLFQFSSSSWESNRSQMGEETDPNIRFNAEESVQTAAYVVSKGDTSIWPNCAP